MDINQAFQNFTAAKSDLVAAKLEAFPNFSVVAVSIPGTFEGQGIVRWFFEAPVERVPVDTGNGVIYRPLVNQVARLESSRLWVSWIQRFMAEMAWHHQLATWTEE